MTFASSIDTSVHPGAYRRSQGTASWLHVATGAVLTARLIVGSKVVGNLGPRTRRLSVTRAVIVVADCLTHHASAGATGVVPLP